MGSAVAPRLAHGLLVHGARLRARALPATARRVVPPLTQEEFWELTKISKVGGTKNARQLAGTGRYLSYEERAPMQFGPGLGLVVGVSLGGESLRAGIVDANGALHHQMEAPTRSDRLKLSPRQVLDDIASAVTEILHHALDDGALVVQRSGRAVSDRTLPILGVAVAWPSPLHRYTKMPEGRALRHQGWHTGFPLTERVAERLGIPADRSHALNDANALALAVAFDETRRGPPPEEAAGRSQVALAVRIGGGLGAGTVVIAPYDSTRSAFLNSYLIEGASGYAGELGHFRVHASDVTAINDRRAPGLAPLDETWECSCGEPMHLEALASATALVKRVLASKDLDLEMLGVNPGGTSSSYSVLYETLERQHNSTLRSALQDAGRLIGGALAGPILMTNPRVITLSGALAVEPVKEGIEDQRPVWKSTLGPQPSIKLLDGLDKKFAGVRGASLAAFRGQVFRNFDTLFSDGVALSRLTLPIGGAELKTMQAGGRQVAR